MILENITMKILNFVQEEKRSRLTTVTICLNGELIIFQFFKQFMLKNTNVSVYDRPGDQKIKQVAVSFTYFEIPRDISD